MAHVLPSDLLVRALLRSVLINEIVFFLLLEHIQSVFEEFLDQVVSNLKLFLGILVVVFLGNVLQALQRPQTEVT